MELKNPKWSILLDPITNTVHVQKNVPCHSQSFQELVQLLSERLCSSHSTSNTTTCESCPKWEYMNKSTDLTIERTTGFALQRGTAHQVVEKRFTEICSVMGRAHVQYLIKSRLVGCSTKNGKQKIRQGLVGETQCLLTQNPTPFFPRTVLCATL